jgi:hypothetical protein
LGLLLRLLRGLIAVQQSHQRARIDPEQEPADQDDDRAHSADLKRQTAPAAAAPVFYIFALAIAAPPHRPPLPGRSPPASGKFRTKPLGGAQPTWLFYFDGNTRPQRASAKETEELK